MITAGGEYGFVLAMIADSFKLRDQMRWYTSMIGKKHTLKRLLAVLRKAGVQNVRTTRFFQVSCKHPALVRFVAQVRVPVLDVLLLLQGQTTRWAIAWSFTGEGIDSLTVSSGSEFTFPFINTDTISVPPSRTSTKCLPGM
jgi:23S rRNA A1618 N6-methylase RlmF